MRAVNLDKEPKRANANTPIQLCSARSEDVSRAINHIRQSIITAVYLDVFLLLEFSEAVGIKSFLGRIFQRARLIEQGTTFQGQVRIDCKRTNIHKTLWLPILKKCIHQIPRCQHRVHKCTRKGFFHACSEMVDNGNPVGSFLTVISGQKISCNKLDIFSGIEFGEHLFEAAKVTRGPNEAAEICKAVFEKLLDHLSSNKAIRPGD